jgi:hypothetical protein
MGRMESLARMMAPRMAAVAKADMTVVVANGHESLKTSILTGTSLLLNRHDLEDLILEGGTEEQVDDLEFFAGQREKIDLFKTFDLAILDETSKLGHVDPFLLFLAAASTSTFWALGTLTLEADHNRALCRPLGLGLILRSLLL